MITQGTLFDIEQYRDAISIDRSNENCRIGAAIEMAFALKVYQMGYDVFMPWGHAQKADLIVRKHPFLAKSVQVKKATPKSNVSWHISTSTKKRTASSGSTWTNYETGDFDILAAYVSELDCWALWTINEIAGKSSVQWNKFSAIRNNFDLLDF